MVSHGVPIRSVTRFVLIWAVLAITFSTVIWLVAQNQSSVQVLPIVAIAFALTTFAHVPKLFGWVRSELATRL